MRATWPPRSTSPSSRSSSRPCSPITVEHIAGLNREARILALNAEIESARAGDAGVAFGVVAKAMSQLSEKNR